MIHGLICSSFPHIFKQKSVNLFQKKTENQEENKLKKMACCIPMDNSKFVLKWKFRCGVYNSHSKNTQIMKFVE